LTGQKAMDDEVNSDGEAEIPLSERNGTDSLDTDNNTTKEPQESSNDNHKVVEHSDLKDEKSEEVDNKKLCGLGKLFYFAHKFRYFIVDTAIIFFFF
jgi:hypothetical protein